ncbi:hypothetical protein BH09SUM1_BH09SUM1_11340 [soil metagenome]
MSEGPNISVIMPCFNAEPWVESAIRSVLSQQGATFDIIVIDDGSTDRSADVVNAINDPRIQLIRQRNQGVSAARNAGLTLARGEFVQFLDADDELLPGKFAMQLERLRKSPQIGLLAGETLRTDADGRVLYRLSQPAGPLAKDRLALRPPFAIHSFLLRRKWVEAFGGFNESLRAGEDWEYYLLLDQSGCEIHFHQDPVCIYRSHVQSASTDSSIMTEDKLRVIEAFVEAKFRDAAKQDAYLTGAIRAFGTDHPDRGAEYLEKARMLDKSTAHKFGLRVANLTAFWARHPMQIDSIEYLKRVHAHLPKEMNFRDDLIFFFEKDQLFLMCEFGRGGFLQNFAKLILRHPISSSRYAMLRALGKV